MNDKFTLLDCDSDVLSCFEQTFKLGNFRKRVNQEFSHKLSQYTQNNNLGLFSFSIENIPIHSSNINWESTTIDCEILRLGYQSWQRGKLRIQVNLERIDVPQYNSRHTTKKVEIQQIVLEFCPDEPEVNSIESPLDDIRQMMNGNS